MPCGARSRRAREAGVLAAGIVAAAFLASGCGRTEREAGSAGAAPADTARAPGSPAPTDLSARPVPGAPGSSWEPWPDGADSSVRASDFVGAAACGECHAREYEAWRRSPHGTAGAAPPSAAAVVAPFDGTPLHFADATVIPRRSEGGGYEFVVRRPGHEEERLRVDAVVGKGHMAGGGTQASLEHLEDGTWRVLPFDFSVTSGRWFCNTEGRRDGGGWVPVGPDLRLESCLDWTPRRVLGNVDRYTSCQECHGSQIRVEVRRGPPHFETRFTSLRVNCESCHGPGRRHVELARSGKIPGRDDIGIASLVGADRDRSLGTCFQCHAFKDALEPGYLPGRRLSAHYSLLSPQLGERPHHVDGRVRTFAYQLNQVASACYLDGGVTCVDCHDPHSQRYRDVWGAALPGRLDDRQCTGCHAARAEHPERHTHHAAGSAGSRCVACHMPYLQEAEIGRQIPYARSDHTIPVPRPQADSALGIEPACRKCHADRSVAELQADVERWWGRLAPRRPRVRALLASDTFGSAGSASLLLSPAPGDPMARYAGLARWFEDRVSWGAALDAEARHALERMAVSGDPDLRGLSLAALDLATADDDADAGRLDSLADADPDSRREVRMRWAQALGWMGDRFRDAGKPDSAALLYRSALGVTPADAELRIGLGYALLAGAHPRAALRELRAAGKERPHDALLLVNEGLALLRLGRTDEATAAYRRAVDVDPSEPLAHFNLGNAYLRAGDPSRAVGEYRRTIELDASLAPPHFNLARALLAGRRYRSALRALRDGLAFDSTDQDARELARRLQAALTGG